MALFRYEGILFMREPEGMIQQPFSGVLAVSSFQVMSKLTGPELRDAISELVTGVIALRYQPCGEYTINVAVIERCDN